MKVGSFKQPTKTTNNVLKKLMTNKVAESFNLTGKGEKCAFGYYKLSKIIQSMFIKYSLINLHHNIIPHHIAILISLPTLF